MSLYKPVSQMTTQEKLAALCHIRRQITVSSLYAQEWLAKATTGTAKLSKTQRGVEGGGWRDLTDDEKTLDALNIVQSHTQTISECQSSENELLLSLTDRELEIIVKLG